MAGAVVAPALTVAEVAARAGPLDLVPSLRLAVVEVAVAEGLLSSLCLSLSAAEAVAALGLSCEAACRSPQAKPTV